MPAPITGTPVTNSAWRFDVDLDIANGGGNWVQVKGMSNFVPSIDSTVQDMSDYDTNGWGSDAVTFRKFKLSGNLNRNKYAGAMDAGQEALRAAAENLTLIHVRWYQRTSGGLAYDGSVLVQWGDQGGGAPGVSQGARAGCPLHNREPLRGRCAARGQLPVTNDRSGCWRHERGYHGHWIHRSVSRQVRDACSDRVHRRL